MTYVPPANASYTILPLGNALPWYSFRTSLTQVIYTLRLRYNTRMARWILDIADAQNNDIINSLPILIERNINQQYVISGLPSGMLFSTDTTGDESQPVRNSFGIDHLLWYFDPTGTT